MKRKTLLQNPVVVVLLCGAAAAVVYFNAVAPLFKENAPAGTAGERMEVAETVAAESAPSSEMPQLSETSARRNDDTEKISVQVINRQRTTTRNPFIPADSSADKLQSGSIGDSAAATESSPRPAQRSDRSGTAASADIPQLQAISRGSAGFVALIGTQMVRTGDTCGPGIVASIDRSTVTLATRRGIRILRLNNRKPGVIP